MGWFPKLSKPQKIAQHKHPTLLTWKGLPATMPSVVDVLRLVPCWLLLSGHLLGYIFYWQTHLGFQTSDNDHVCIFTTAYLIAMTILFSLCNFAKACDISTLDVDWYPSLSAKTGIAFTERVFSLDTWIQRFHCINEE